MDDKYFKPEIEDIHVGYECENISNSQKMNIQPDDIESIIINISTGLSTIRTPYLTKEQIEKEGWSLTSWKNRFKKFNYYLDFSFKDGIDIHLGEGTYIYSGKCKDINTFRRLCKLLEL